MIFLKRIKQHSKKNINKVIFTDYKRKWTWFDVFKKVDEIIKILKPHIHDKQTSLPIIVSRRAEVLISFIACLKLGISFTPIIYISNDQSFFIANKLNSNFFYDPVNNKIKLNSKYKINSKKQLDIKNKIYILFTSGSTGNPKGVICDKENIINTLLWSKIYLKWKKNDVIGNVTQFSFDISLFDFFSTIYFNIPLTIIKSPENTDYCYETIKKSKITSIFSTPSFFSQFVFNDSVKKTTKTSLKQIISGGDFFPTNHLFEWISSNKKINIFNVWGPTETSIVNSMYKIKQNDKKRLKEIKYLPVGKSTKRMKITIIKSNKLINEPNKIGFICLSGKSICKGYINENQKYKNMIKNINNKIYFNTGDLGYFDSSKNLFIIGRIDNTIKIQGYRINQKEIEKLSESFDNIFLSASYKKNLNNDFNQLNLLIQLKKTRSFDIYKFKSFLRTKLPFYKVPKEIKIIKKIPLNSNGKIDRIQIDKKYNLNS
ncbi:MAG: hypothetical protein CMG00_00955 [Candidatus Marinimicrobia bacterium]|nr:hypothetical protein [Candidatus Neomarinimicrobiota bacterium]|tara:strand:- start:5452 stop:6912 length:1461 start_codon:yes stop_codon:yes gene_type:complete